MIRPPENEQELRRFYQDLCLVVNKVDVGRTVSVTDYGAKGDGVTDDRAAIQAAIDAADAVGGGTVFLPSGTYNLATKNTVSGKHVLTLASNIRFIGAGMGATTLKADDNLATDSPLVWGDNISLVEIAYMTIDGNKSRAAAGGEDEGIDLKTVNLIWIHHVEIKDTEQDAIDLDATEDEGAWITDCYIHDCNGLAVHCRGTGSGRIVIRGNEIHDVNPARVDSCACIDHQGPGPLIITENNISGRMPIEVSTEGHAIISNNNLVCTSNVDWPAVHLYSNNLRAIVQGNSIRLEGTASRGIVVSTLAPFAVNIANNTIEHACMGVTTQIAVDIGTSGGPVKIFGLVTRIVVGTGQTGIRIGALVTHYYTIYGCNIDGDSAKPCILINGSEAEGFISGNTTYDGYAGVEVASGENVTITANRMFHSGQRCIRLDDLSADCTITGNHLGGNANSNVSIGTGTGHVFRNNVGFLSESRGTDTIADTTSSKSFSHGLGGTGVAADRLTPTSVVVTPRGNEAIWVSARDGQNITVARVGTTADLVFDWQAEV